MNNPAKKERAIGIMAEQDGVDTIFEAICILLDVPREEVTAYQKKLQPENMALVTATFLVDENTMKRAQAAIELAILNATDHQ